MNECRVDYWINTTLIILFTLYVYVWVPPGQIADIFVVVAYH